MDHRFRRVSGYRAASGLTPHNTQDGRAGTYVTRKTGQFQEIHPFSARKKGPPDGKPFRSADGDPSTHDPHQRGIETPQFKSDTELMNTTDAAVAPFMPKAASWPVALLRQMMSDLPSPSRSPMPTTCQL